MDYLKLKSGSDVRGVASGNGEIQLTDDVVRAIVNAFVVWLAEKSAKPDLKIAVGHDSRVSADRITAAVADALKTSGGVDIYMCGLASTPAMFMMTRYEDTNADGSIMITASHMPSDKNGLKFFTKAGGLSGADITEILQYAQEGKCRKGHVTRSYTRDFMQLYCNQLIDFVRRGTGSDWPLTGFKIVVDAGNGAGGFYAERVLKPLGASTTGSQFLEPDGRFPNHIPNPEDKDAMKSISKCVLDSGADLGIIFDTDVDRAAIVSADGTEINRSSLIALAADIVLSENPGAVIVTDSVTSDGLHNYIVRRGGVHHRFKRGYRNVIDEAARLNREGKNAVLAMETSGHAAFKDNFFLDDGAYLVTRLIIKMARLKSQNLDLKSLISDLEIPKEEREIRISFNVENWADYGAMLIKHLTELCTNKESIQLAPDNYEGVRANIDYAQGWFLARMSVHDPVMVINLESNAYGGTTLIARFLYAFLSSFSGVDTTELKIVAGM
ncbi:MAG: phosphomannomutase/phosphoglucomutase [Clostridia bacterium]|nr:phosphomannomutase/phosphoglucomutase [Clostridia bacterium]